MDNSVTVQRIMIETVMKFSLVLKNDQMTPYAEKVLNKYITSLSKKLTNFADDIPDVSLFIKKHDKNHFFSGLIILTLPRKKLTAKIAGHTITEIIHSGFEKLNKEFEKYKGTHFKGSSKYPYHETIADQID